jgi:ribosome-interacting GTPase 1
MLMMVLDAGKPHSHREILTRELEAVGIRLNRSPPRIYLKPKKTGGVHFNSTVPLTHLDDKLVYRVMQEYKMHNADILFQEDCTVDDLIDVMEVRPPAATARALMVDLSHLNSACTHWLLCRCHACAS